MLTLRQTSDFFDIVERINQNTTLEIELNKYYNPKGGKDLVSLKCNNVLVFCGLVGEYIGREWEETDLDVAEILECSRIVFPNLTNLIVFENMYWPEDENA